MAASSIDGDDKPVFGPHVSLELLHKRLVTKFSALDKNWIPSEHPKPKTPAEVEPYTRSQYEHFIQVLPHILCCHREAKALGLDTTARNASKEEGLALDNACVRLEYDRNSLDKFTLTMADTKMGDRLHGMLPWQRLSLEFRRRLTDLIEAVEKQRKLREWVVNKSVEDAMDEITGWKKKAC